MKRCPICHEPMRIIKEPTGDQHFSYQHTCIVQEFKTECECVSCERLFDMSEDELMDLVPFEMER